MRWKPTWLWAVVLWAACGGSAYKVNRTGGSAAGGAGGAGGTVSSDAALGGATSAPGGGTVGEGGSAGSAGTTRGTGNPATGGASATGGAPGTGGSTGGTATPATGGASVTGGAPGTGGTSSTGGTSLILQPCNSSDGSGCSDTMSCVDNRSDACSPDTQKGCSGYCVPPRDGSRCAGLAPTTTCPDGFACVPDTRTYLGTDPVSICVGDETECGTSSDCPTGFVCVPGTGGGRCSPERVVCDGDVTCKVAEPPACPAGYGRSTPDACYGPCVPVDFCLCSTDAECARAQASCDRRGGRCFIPKSPEPRCQLPFDIGPCDGAMRVYAFLDGECKPATYGGCGGNDNRFSTLEECLSRCQGMPGERPCPDGRVERVICLGCGMGGGCIQRAGVCAKTCTTQTDCQPSGLSCSGGYCEAAFCI